MTNQTIHSISTDLLARVSGGFTYNNLLRSTTR
jgi:hypothetical protein